MRLFLAINFPPEVRDRLFQATAVMREAEPRIRWVTSPLLHVTLKFLGEQPQEMVPPLMQRVRSAVAGVGAIRASISGVGTFPNFRRPRIVWIGVQGDDRLSRVVERVEGACVDSGLAAEERPFRAHITLGRVRDELRGADAARLEEVARTVRAREETVIGTVDLMESTLSPAGSRYRVVATAPLGRGTT